GGLVPDDPLSAEEQLQSGVPHRVSDPGGGKDLDCSMAVELGADSEAVIRNLDPGSGGDVMQLRDLPRRADPGRLGGDLDPRLTDFLITVIVQRDGQREAFSRFWNTVA